MGLGRKVIAERALGDIRGSADIVDLGLVDSLLSEENLCRFEDVCPKLLDPPVDSARNRIDRGIDRGGAGRGLHVRKIGLRQHSWHTHSKWHLCAMRQIVSIFNPACQGVPLSVPFVVGPLRCFRSMVMRS
jgi:hypothetical protein